MRVGFFNIYDGSRDFSQTVHLVLADMLIRSVRKVMPDVEIVQLTDERSPRLIGVDSVRRIASREPMAVQCVTHYAQHEGNWLYVDTDVVIQKDVRHIFEHPFDIAVCDREGTKVQGEDDEDFTLFKEMPYNIGVVFSRNCAFWQEVKNRLLEMDAKRQRWMGNQAAACQVISELQFKVKIISGRDYNCPPLNKKDRCEDASIVHFKGQMRKRMALARFAEV